MAHRHKFGQKTPPLYKYIQDILIKYPDGGQILKELIQNAEDAGASEVRFLYDRTQYGTKTLRSPKLVPCQGPALCAYNDACFTEEDWENIQNLSMSVKKGDPMKIGRFGQGFNSVYHLTDLPMILSGSRVAILDPHKNIFLIDGEWQSGCDWHLIDDAEEIERLQDQFSPFKNLFEFEGAEDPFKTGFFDGTIFRFPLRQKPSKISATLYDDGKIVDLFDSFKSDGDIVLLFLHHVRSVKLISRKDSGQSATEYRVSMSNPSEHERASRFHADVEKALKVPVDNRETIVNTCRFSMTVDGLPTQDWLVTNYVKGRGISEEAQKLSEELSLLPWVGVAMPMADNLPPHNNIDPGGGRKLDGRTFCCLPLPEESSLSTGLPVHVHGFFGVSDNRRSLKWTLTDQKSDSAAKWNEVLVREILPSAYARLVADATHCCDRNALYRALPDMHHTAQHWKPALRPFFNIVLNQKVVWTPANDGKWITPKDAVFNRTSVSTAVLDYLVGAGLDVVELPEHVMQAVDHTFSRSSLNEVTPELLRTTMKRRGVQNWLREYKLAWLQYVLDDKKYAAMEGIELLPLADKTFTTFSTKHDKTIFIDSEEHPRTLLPGLSGRFLDTDIDKPTLHHLQKAAREAEGKARNGQPCLQLRHLTPQLVASHLRDALPPDWLQVSHVTWYPGARSQQPSADWLPQLWQYLKAHFAEDLSPFVGLPILPVVGMNATHMVRLEQPSTVIRPKYGETTMPDVIKNLVRDVGATVLEPPYLDHPRLEEFIHRCTPQGLLRILIAVGADKVVPKVGALSAEAKGALRAFVAKGDSLHDTERRLLAKLPIFEAVDDSNLKPRYLAALGPGENMRQIAPDLTTDPLPKGLSFPKTVIVTRDLESQTIGQLLGLQHLSTTELLAGMIEKVRLGDYTTEHTDSLMLWILKRLHTLQATGTDPSILKKIQTLPFVTTNSNTKVAPTELFSPEETDSGVLLGEPVFPGPPYAEKAILAPLLLLGMRQKVSAQDILRSAKNVQTFYDSGKLTLPETKRKAAKIVSVLDHKMLTTLVKGVFLKTALMDVSFLPVCSKRPSSYLPGLQWYPAANNAAFVSPRDARGSECAELVGATMPIVDDGRISADFISAFGWDKDRLPIKKVVEQLKTLCSHYRESTRPDKHRVVPMLTKIYQHIDARLAAGETAASAALRLLSSPGFPPWVWQGDGLAAPNAVALTSPFNFSLAPYRFILPEDPEFRDFEQMFTSAGVKESLNQTDLVETLQEINQQSTPKMSTEVERDLKLSVDIIGWLVHDPDILEEVQERMLVPIATKDSTCLVLEPVSECTYNDESWSDAQDILDDDEDEEFKLLHELIPLDTAQRLGVPSLSQRVVDAEEFGFDQCGQYEKVTQRLKNILNDYPGGAGIFKELIQNADDARATEVKFLVDWRKNEDSRKDLIDKGMEVCHGPALWAYNNATFSEEDFKNIQNLGGQTKLEALEKVGRFGVGFNYVYHVTDVPSFVSGSRVMFFDPHATHLPKHIKDKSKPGIGLDLQKNKRLSRFINQFKPFQGVFGYSTSTPYRGTLFRLPLRTPQEAAVSEISDESYSTPDNKNMKKLIERFKEGLKSLILFTQNVRQVTMYTLDESEDPSSMVETFHVSKSPVKYLREMQIQSPSHSHKLNDKFQFQSNCLWATSEVVKHQETIRKKDCLETSMIVKVTCRQKEGKDMSEEWIISSCMGTKMSERGKTEGLVPCGGVAALLKSSDGSHQDASKDSYLPNGEVFCFLPLSIRTDLPVHVNGSFAVASNRGGLWEETSTDPNDQKVEWNKALMEDAVCKAYITMLLDLSDMAKKGLLLDILTPYQYHRFWPNPRHITGTSHYSILVRAFYDALTSHGTPPPLFESGGQWLSFTSAVFLDPGITFNSCENVAARRALQQCLPDYTVTELPEWARQGFEQAGCAKLLSDHTYTEERFYRKLFFPMIHELSNKTRDPLMLRILGRENEEYNELIRTTACIPTSPRGQELSCPGDLIHPDGKLSAMFLPEDQRFPHGSKDTAYLNPFRLQVLTELGMCKDDAPWDVVIERAESVVRLNEVNQNASRKRIVALLDFIDVKTRDKRDKKGQQQAGKQLSTIPFLPIMQKPHEWPFDWKGSEYPAYALLSAAVLQPSKSDVIAGVACPIICSRIVTTMKGRHSSTYTVPHSLSSFLGLEDKSPNLSETLTNLMAIVTVDMKTLSKEGLDCTKKTYLKTCQHLQKLCKGSKCNENEIGTRLSKTPFIMIMSQTAKRFLLPSDVSFGLKFSCAPYLYRVPDELATELRPLLLVCKVKKTFEACDFIRALDHLKEDRGNKTLKSHEVNLALALLKAASDLEDEDIQKRSLWIPDESGVLRRPSGVCYNDCAWIKQKEGMVFCHKGLARDLAVDKLGVKPVRHKSLEAYSHNLSCFGTDFGQVEQLTNRIKNLLDAYPFGKEILKELLQNADDAGATEIQFVFDKRQHGTKYIFDDAWKDLQGPALCVYNNRPFTEEDLTGIQNLGKGSKGQDPVKTGKYGVGFNAVYHLTDCPSFMTGGDTLCVFDPQLRFVPGAKQECPGRMLRDIDADLREQYKDVFGCYLKDQAEFSSPDSTMFRFPLRTAAMAECSEISNKEVTEKTILELIDTFKEESFEVLLFLNSVEKIKISIIETDGTSKEVYHAEALISEEAKQDRRDFADYVAECAHSEEPLEELPTHHVTYNLDLRDNSQHQESWIVHQRIGFEDKDIPNSMKEAHASSELGLLPRGGAAICHKHCKQPALSKAHHQSESDQKCYHMGPKRAFCFLPLPIDTKLPVHVNGHFALDHEARRNLWKDEKGGMKSDWNKTLIKEVIAPAYAAVLDAKRTADFDEEQKPSAPKARDISKSLESYHSLFPSVSKTAGQWNDLSIAFYQHIDREHLRLLPVLRSTADDCRPTDGEPGNSSHNQMTTEWLPPTGAGKDEAFFNTLEYRDAGSTERDKKPRREVLKETLLALGFNLLASPKEVLDAFQEAEVDVKEVKPESVVNFLQTYADDDPLCRIGASLPAPVSSTSFKEPENLQVVLHYCLSSTIDKNKEHKLHGVPLLLTPDKILRVFDLSNPVFATKFADLVPSTPHLFVDRSCLSDLQRQDTDKSVLSFDVEALSSLLPRELNESKLRQGNTVEWNQSPPQYWIYRLWQFLDHEMPKKESDQDTYLSTIKTLFGDWAVLPACTHSPTMGPYDASTFSTYDRIPMVQPGKTYMVPLGEAHTVVTFDVGASSLQQIKVAKAMRKLHCLELNIHSLRGPLGRPFNAKPTQLARRLVSSLTNHVGILRVFTSLFDAQRAVTSTPLDADDATELLKYFEEEVDKLKTEEANLDMLRSLPLYKTIHEKLISLRTTIQCHVLPAGIPTADIDEWISRSDAVFLERNHSLKKLHTALGCSRITDAEVYRQYIFPNMDHLSDEAVKEHLEYLRRMLISTDTVEKHARTRESLLPSLRHLRIIPSEEGRKPVSDFYDDDHPVFREMVSDENFLPEYYRTGMWKKFFVEIGIIHKVTNLMFLQYAREVARVTRSKESRLTEKSNVLVEHFFTMKTLSEGSFIKEVSGIRFIAPVEARPDLVKLHSQHGANDDVLPFVCFKNSVPEHRQELCWTRANLLPNSVTQKLQYQGDYEALCRQLGIQVQPSMDTVTNHVTCLCQHLAHQKNTEMEEGANSPSACKALWKVMLEVYKFLSKKASEGGSLKKKLGNVPCMAVEGGKRLVRPEQVAINLDQEHEIRPYLYGMPIELGQYHKLFVSLGATEKPTPMQYAKILEALYVSSGSQPLNPNEKMAAYSAIFGMFRCLKPESSIQFGKGKPYKTREVEDSFHKLQCLYLPSRESRLLKSAELVFDDTPQFTDRVKDGFNYPILVRLENCRLFADEHELIDRLPSHLRPKNLSSLVQEQLCDEDEQMTCTMGANCVLESRLASLFLSTYFRHAIVRLSKHTLGERCDDKKVIAAVEKFVSSVTVCCKRKLITCLVYKESQDRIEDSEGTSYCFIKDNTLYVAHTDAPSEEYESFQCELTEVINDALGRPLVNLVHLGMVLSVKDPSDIPKKLDKAKIKRYTSGEQDDSPLPSLGTPIPEVYHHLLTSNPAHYFTPGDYVGFEVYDPDFETDSEEEEKEYTMTFLYAQVIKEEPTDTELKFNMGREYVIDVGYTKTVSAVDLYKFCRPYVPGPLVPYEGEIGKDDASAAKPPQSLEDAMEEVSNILEEAWKLPEKERKKVVRRLYLQWHPDKNPDNVELATEVTKHILAEISRLEKGFPRRTKGGDGSGGGDFDFGGSSFSSSFTRWNAYAGYHRHQREQFHERYRGGDFSGWRTGSGQWVPPRSDGGGFPNPREAARWHRQAAADLRAARSNLSGPDASYEWTCLMCHQTAEKALKAVQLGKFGRYDMIHRIGGMGRALEASCGGKLAGLGDAAMELSSLGSYPGCDDVYLRARYPNLHPAARVPHDAFTRQHAETAVRLAQSILDRTEDVLN